MPAEPVNVADYEALARARMEPDAFDYFAGGAGDELTLEANRDGFRRLSFVPRVLVDVSRVDTSTTLLGLTLPLPVALAPTAYHRLAHAQGEVATARGAGAAGALMVASTMATRTLEDIAAAASAPLWFQLYVHNDRGTTEQLVRRAEAAGYRALVLTVDTPVLGIRERDARSGFKLPAGMPPANFHPGDPALAAPAPPGSASLRTQSLAHLDASLTWDVLEYLRGLTRMPIVLKGIMDPADARRAVETGAAGLVVSNHGGRQLDGTIATIAMLPEVVDAVGGAIPVLMDGGVRRGTDVLKALALGAAAVLIGRPYLWGLAADGEAGVTRVIERLRDELANAMAIAGRPTIASVDRSLVRFGR